MSSENHIYIYRCVIIKAMNLSFNDVNSVVNDQINICGILIKLGVNSAPPSADYMHH